tara:strand:- start:215 stop:559 length:345 start_codon:yes stop_codon:yes gene_type:complete
MSYIQSTSPLKDAKFLTSLQPAATDPKRLIKMTPAERTESRKGLAKMTEWGLMLNSGLGLVAKLASGGKALLGAVGAGGLTREFFKRGLFASSEVIGSKLPKEITALAAGKANP